MSKIPSDKYFLEILFTQSGRVAENNRFWVLFVVCYETNSNIF
jgi:hypothetical protein